MSEISWKESSFDMCRDDREVDVDVKLDRVGLNYRNCKSNGAK